MSDFSGDLYLRANPRRQLILTAWWNAEYDTVTFCANDGSMRVMWDMSVQQWTLCAEMFDVKALQVAMERDQFLSQRTQPMETSK